MQGTTISSIPPSTLPDLQDIVNLHRGDQVVACRDEFIQLKDSLWSNVNGLMKSVVSILGSNNEIHLNVLKTGDFAVDNDILRDKRTAFSLFKGKDAQSRVIDALGTVDRFVNTMAILLGKFDVLSKEISRYLTDHSRVLEQIARPMVDKVITKSLAENPNGVYDSSKDRVTTNSFSNNLKNDSDTEDILANLEIQLEEMTDSPNDGKSLDAFGQIIYETKRVSDTSNSPKTLVSSLKKTSGSRTTDHVKFSDESSKKDNSNSSNEQAESVRKRKSCGSFRSSDGDDVDNDPDFRPSVNRKKKIKSKKTKVDEFSAEHFAYMLTMREKPVGKWRSKLLAYIPHAISSHFESLASNPDQNLPMFLEKFKIRYKKWISPADLQEIRKTLLGKGVDATAFESQFPCLAA